MATCYRCGRPIASTDFKLRRRVKTGDRIIRRYPNPHVMRKQTSYGIRLLCASCAQALDWQARREELLHVGELVLILFLVLAALVYHSFS